MAPNTFLGSMHLLPHDLIVREFQKPGILFIGIRKSHVENNFDSTQEQPEEAAVWSGQHLELPSAQGKGQMTTATPGMWLFEDHCLPGRPTKIKKGIAEGLSNWFHFLVASRSSPIPIHRLQDWGADYQEAEVRKMSIYLSISVKFESSKMKTLPGPLPMVNSALRALENVLGG